jgi:hypothetical protein
MGRKDINEMAEAILDELKHFKEKFEKAYAKLYGAREKGRKNIESQKEGRSPTFQRDIDTYLKGLDIIFNKEQKKYEDTLRNIDDAIEAAEKVKNKAKRETIPTEKIIEAINSLIPFIEKVFIDSQFIINRIGIIDASYTLYKQEELKQAGLNFPEKRQFLEKELAEIKPGLNISTESLGAFKAARGRLGEGVESRLYDLKDRKKKDWLSPTALDRKRIEEDKKIIGEHLADISPDNLHTIPKKVQEKIQNYISSRNIARQAANDKNEPYPETEIEKLIYAKTGMRGEEIVGRETLFPKPDTEGLTNKTLEKTLPSPAKVEPKVNTEETSPSPEKVKNKVKRKVKTKETIEKIIPEAALGVNTSPIEDVIANTAPVADTPTSNKQFSLPPILEVLRQQQGLPSSSSIYPDLSKLNISAMSTDMAPEVVASSPAEVVSNMASDVVASSSKKAGSGGGGKRTGGRGKTSGSGGAGIGGGGIGSTGGGSGSINIGEFKGIIDVRLVDISTSAIKQLDDLLVKVLSNPSISIKGGGGGGTGDMDKLAEELKKSRESNEKLAQMSEARRKAAKAEATKKKKEKEKEKKRIADPNSPESIAKRKKEADAAEREQKRKEREQKRLDRENPDSPENIAKRNKEEEKKRKEKEKNKKAKNPIADLDPFQKRLKKIYEEGREEITLLYAKVNSYLPIFTNAQVEAKKTALNTLKEGYRAFNIIYQRTGSSFKGMMAAINKMFKISPATVILAGMTVAFTGILSAANRLNTRIKEISAELGTSNMQSYELFKNAMNAQTQYDNMYASLRDVRDVQKGILGDSGILLQTNDKALASVADNAKNIGLSVESAGAFYENLRMKGGSDKEASNLMAASLELADKKGFSPQSIVDDIAQNAEFASKYFSNINKHSKSAHRNLIETNLQVKALGLNFQKAAKMTQHLLSFEQSIVAEVEASVALGRHVNIGKARELLLQDDIAGAMTQMMDTMGGYDEFQNMDFAKRQLMANAIGMEVSELEKSLYLREKIGLKDAESLDAAMRNSDYLDKVAGKDAELYKIETKKVMAAERFNTAIEKVSVAFKSSLLPILEAIIPIVDHMAWAINLVAGGIKAVAGFPGKLISIFTGAQAKQDGSSNTPGLDASMAIGMTSVMGGLLLKTLRGKIGGKIGEVVGKARGGLDAVTGTLGSKSNPMYVQIVGGGGGAGGIGEILDSAVGGGNKGGRAGLLKRMFTSKDVVDRAKSIQKIRDSRLSTPKTGAFAKIGQYMSKVKPASMIKLGGALAVFSAGYDIYNRKQKGQSTSQVVAGTAGGVAGGLGGALVGAKGGALLGAAIGTAIAGPVGTAIGAGFGGLVGGLTGGIAGSYAGGAIVDSQFNKKPSSSYETQPFQYQGMGLSATGSIYGGVNKPKAKGTPVETSMVDMTPTTFKTMSSGISGISPNYGTTTMARESVMVNTLSKSVEATALMKSVKEKNIEKEKAHKEMMEQQLKILESIREKINQPAVAFFTDEGRRQVINQSRVRNSH